MSWISLYHCITWHRILLTLNADVYWELGCPRHQELKLWVDVDNTYSITRRLSYSLIGQCNPQYLFSQHCGCGTFHDVCFNQLRITKIHHPDQSLVTTPSGGVPWFPLPSRLLVLHHRLRRFLESDQAADLPARRPKCRNPLHRARQLHIRSQALCFERRKDSASNYLWHTEGLLAARSWGHKPGQMGDCEYARRHGEGGCATFEPRRY